MFCKPNYFWRHLFLLLIIGLYHTSVAQNLNKYEWAKGEVILTNGDTLAGALSYYYKKEIIQVKGADGIIKTFSPVNVAQFQAFNEQKQLVQIFRPYRWQPNPVEDAFKTPAFFEVVTQGKYTLIKRSAYVIRNADPIPMYTLWGRYYEPCTTDNISPQNNDYQIALLNSYYLLTPENEIISLRKPKKNLEDLYRDKTSTMKAFIRWNKLSYDNPVALTHMVHHFNHL